MNLHDWWVSVASPLGDSVCDCLVRGLSQQTDTLRRTLERFAVKRPLLPLILSVCGKTYGVSGNTIAVCLCVCVCMHEVRVKQYGWIGPTPDGPFLFVIWDRWLKKHVSWYLIHSVFSSAPIALQVVVVFFLNVSQIQPILYLISQCPNSPKKQIELRPDTT